MPLVRMILPVAVILKRFLAPLWVFIFLGALLLLTSSVSFLVAVSFALPIGHTRLGLEGRHEHDHGAAFHPGRLFDRAVRTELIGELIEQRLAQIGVGHLAAAKKDGEFHFVPGVEELGRLPPLRLEVVIVDLRPDANFFQFDDMLMTSRLALFPALLVAVLPVVHEPADGWHGIRRHLDQVEPTLARHLKRIECRDDADLLAVLIDQPNLADPDALIDAGLDGSGNSLPPLPITGLRSTYKRANAPGAISGAVALGFRRVSVTPR